MKLPRRNQFIGSKQTGAPVCRCEPSGVPISGAPAPTDHGHSPATWAVVARYSTGRPTTFIRPPPGPA
ncbi:Uncharacterised protein [Mycobacteroides abscessus subsp. abscessus]|nr:Uncharacterised protein [Mycobacteroides abscessus subsp. abscessus]